MNDPFTQQISAEINKIYPFVFDRLEELESLPKSVSENVIQLLLSYACVCQNDANIHVSRKAVARIPHEFRLSLLPRVIDKSNYLFADEWEFRRLLELLKAVEPSLIPRYVARGMASHDQDIREAAQDNAQY